MTSRRKIHRLTTLALVAILALWPGLVQANYMWTNVKPANGSNNVQNGAYIEVTATVSWAATDQALFQGTTSVTPPPGYIGTVNTFVIYASGGPQSGRFGGTVMPTRDGYITFSMPPLGAGKSVTVEFKASTTLPGMPGNPSVTVSSSASTTFHVAAP